MTTLKQFSRAVLGGLLALGASSALHAATLSTLTAAPTNDGILQNFSGIDWNANGAAWVQGFVVPPNAFINGTPINFTLTYQAFASSIGTTSTTNNLYVAAPGPQNGTYELTTYATLSETATCANLLCTSINIVTNPTSTWAVYFDTTPDANQGAGTGFLDGVQILGGNFTNGLTSFTAFGPVGSPGAIGVGGGLLSGTVSFTNSAYVAPDLLGTTLQASLIFPGQSSPTYTRPTAFNGTPTLADTATNFVLQTDTSQNFVAAAIPEPNTVMLLAIGLLGMCAFVKRRN